MDGTRGALLASTGDSFWTAVTPSSGEVAGTGTGSALTESVPSRTTTSGCGFRTGRGGRTCSMSDTNRTG